MAIKVSELIEKLQELENKGHGDDEVVFDDAYNVNGVRPSGWGDDIRGCVQLF